MYVRKNKNEISPYLINTPIQEIVNFKIKMISGLLQKEDYICK